MDPLQWMGAVRVRVKAADKNKKTSQKFQKTLIDKLVLWIIGLFLSAVWTLILTVPIHCRGSIGEQKHLL